jgi:regulator of ribonuclease activity A
MALVMTFTTPDLSDASPEAQWLPYQFCGFGLRERFAGPVSTIACHIDNSRVAEAVEEPGAGRVLLIDGQESLQRSLLGDRLAEKAFDNQWAGIVVIGAVRDVEIIDQIDIGVRSLGVCPVKTDKKGLGDRDKPLSLREVLVEPGDWLYADRNGVLVSKQPLHSA